MNNISKELIEELKEVKRKFNETISYNKEQGEHYELYKDIEECFPSEIIEYAIITSDKVMYIINSLSDEFYDFDFDKIIYIYKHIHSDKNDSWDTVNGYYNDYNLFKKTINSFNVIEQVDDFVD